MVGRGPSGVSGRALFWGASLAGSEAERYLSCAGRPGKGVVGPRRCGGVKAALRNTHAFGVSALLVGRRCGDWDGADTDIISICSLNRARGEHLQSFSMQVWLSPWPGGRAHGLSPLQLSGQQTGLGGFSGWEEDPTPKVNNSDV